MKILKLHFKNLNSLVGEWEINFTAPEYSEQGIFAITGPTGAGKSTLLDAICLALYGRTPRLERINASQNEIMSRQCGECFASLEFKTATGHYRTLWSQSRARKKSTGNLQGAQHSIEDCQGNKTLEDKLSKTSLLVTEVTGMDFEHFTRAMLLAQGSFAKFLQSTADERSPILEKITGTEIYSQISKLVHERKTIEENTLATINVQLAGIRLLNEREMEELDAELAELTREITALINNKNQFEKQHIWLINLQKLRDELGVIQQAQQQLYLQQELFAADELRLKNAKIVEEINSDIYIRLQEIRKQVIVVQHNLSVNQERLPQLQELLIAQQTQVIQASDELAKYKANHTLNLKTLQQVRLLDAEILTKQDGLAKVTAKLNTSRGDLNRLLFEQQNFIIQQTDQSQQQIQINHYLTENQSDASLLSSYSGICAELDNLLAFDEKIKNYQAQQIIRQDNYSKLTKLISEQAINKTKFSSDQAELNSKVTQLEQNIFQLANGKNIAEFKDEILQLNSRHNDYRDLAKQLQEKATLALKLQQIQVELNHEQCSLVEMKSQLDREEKLFDYSNQLLDNLTTQKLLQSKIINLSDERINLQPSQPCPLCGALEHPYAADGVLINNEIDAQIIQAKAQVNQSQAKLTKLNTHIATNDANIVKLSELQHDLVSRLDLVQQSVEILVDRNPQIDQQITEVKLQPLLEQITAQINQLNSQIKQLQDYELQLADYQVNQQQLEKLLINIKLDLIRFTEQKLAIEKQLADVDKQINIVHDEYEKLYNSLIAALTNYQVQVITCDTIPVIKENLATRRDTWQTKEQQADSLKQELQRLNHQLEQNNSLQTLLNGQIVEQQQEVVALQEVIDSLSLSRRNLFADKNTDDAELQWQNELHLLEENFKASDAKLNQLNQQQIELTTLINNASLQLQLLQENQAQSEEQLAARLKSVGIINETEFLSKQLSRDEMAIIQQKADALKQQAIELTSRLKQTSEALAEEQFKQLTDKTSDELDAEIASLQINYENYNQRIGEIRGQLAANQQSQVQQQGILARHDEQLLITERFRRLHFLIGSSDGKKFRNFAQGLTFELVVKHSNQQLRQMSDRYLLIRDNDAPLELNVIDNYQGGEIRSTKNLSGGESFVISLALALGLSKLSSNKVQVDSLFLDEGFGTLDEDSLQTALDALDSLQRDGKLIGVISHVGALKDRISLQIQVEPLSGGVSLISGVGCVGVSNP